MSEFKLPDLGEGLAEAVIREWHIEEGIEIETDSPLVTVETAKAIVEVPSPKSGVIAKIHAKSGSTVQTGALIVSFKSDDKKNSATVVGQLEDTNEIINENPTGIKNPIKQTQNIKAMPAARLFAKKHNIDLSCVNTNSNRVISLQDVEKHMAYNLEISRKNITNSMCHIMEKSKASVVPATIQDDINISAWKGKQDITVRIIQALVFAIKQEPKLNSHFENISKQLIAIPQINIGIAMQTENGLFVPTLTNLQNSLPADAIRDKIDNLKNKAKTISFEQEDLTTPSIILSNIGTVAGKYATPVVVPPSVAIIATGMIRAIPHVVGSDIKICNILPVSISFDHRGITGSDTALFLKHFMANLSLDIASPN